MSRSWTPKPYFCGGRAYYKAFSLGTYGLLCAFLLSSCGQSGPGGYTGSPESSVSSATLEPLTAPPNQNDRPPAPGMTGAPKTADGLPALQSKGVNTNLFSQKMTNEADRLDRLENAVQELRNDFDNMAPAIVRLVAIEGDIQGLIKQLDVLTGKTPPGDLSAGVPPIDESALDQSAAPKSAAAPAAPQNIMPPVPGTPQPLLPPQPAPAQEPVATPASPAAAMTPAAAEAAAPSAAMSQAPVASSGPAVMDIRVGEHPDKTRIVLDLRGKASFTTDLDNQEKLLVIEIPEAGWNAKPQMTFGDSPMIASYRVQKSGDHGSMLILSLKKGAAISYKGTMDNDSKTGQKLVIDISPAR